MLLHKIFFWSACIFIAAFSFLFFKFSPTQSLEVSQAASKQLLAAQPVAAFDPHLLTWNIATLAAPWTARDSAVSFVFKNRIWLMGGLNGNDQVDSSHKVRYWEAQHFNDIWSSSDGISWQLEKESAEWSKRRSMSVVFFRDMLWMFGGWSQVTGYTSDIWQSVDAVTWTKLETPAGWPAREGQAVEVFANKLWLIGGVNYDTREVKNDIWHSEDGIHWQQVDTPPPWSPRWDHATAVFNGKLFLTGGMNLTGQTFGDVWSSSDGIHWELVDSEAEWKSRQGHSLIHFKDYLWLVGRLNDDAMISPNDVWYTKDGTTWHKTNTNPAWLGREDHNAQVFNNKIYVFGGMGSDWRWKNDVWHSTD